MITIEESQKLIEHFISLKKQYQKTKNDSDLQEFRLHEKKCIEQFSYLVFMRTSRYKNFSNYDDLNNDGMEALVKAMKNYDPAKGNFFWWSHKYIDTKIARSANLHTTIRYPLKYAKNNSPRREALPNNLIEKSIGPEKLLEDTEIAQNIKSAMKSLTEEQKKIIDLAYGFDGDKPASINKICKIVNAPRSRVIKCLNVALGIIRNNIKL
jgi:RNA polymerase sigma factor (sigma-70 family)